jgi:AcrR family transcriptional regulator
MTDTRGAMLEAGVRLYGTLAGDLLRGLTAGTVAQEAGYHRQTFYRYWETQSEYVQDLIRHLLDPAVPPEAAGATVLADPPRSRDDLTAYVQELAAYDYARVVEDRHIAMRVGLLMMEALSDDVAREQAQTYYDGVMTRIGEAYEEMLAGFGLEPRPPLDARDVARVLHGLLLGLVVQSKAARDEPHGSALFETGASALLEALTQPVAD